LIGQSKRRHAAALLLGGSFLIPPSLAFAASADEASGAWVEDVVVTARKREEALQSVPVTITAATAQQLDAQRIEQPSDLARLVPSLSSTVGGIWATGPQFTLRGQSSADILLTLSSPVGLYIDGVNVPHAVGTNAAFFDLQRIEAVKGPQGTLYGRNTTAGALNVYTRDADHDGLHGYIEGELTNFEGRKLTTAVNIPLVQDKLSARLAFQRTQRDGYARSIVTGQKLGGVRDDSSFRLSLQFDPVSTFTLKTKLEYADISTTGAPSTFLTAPPVGSTLLIEANAFGGGGVGGGAAQALANSCFDADLFTSCSGTVTSDDVEYWHGVVDASWDLTDAITLRSITGYHRFQDINIFDFDGTPYGIRENGMGVGGRLYFLTGAATPPLGATLPNGTLAPPGPYLFPEPLRPDQESTLWTQEFNLSGASFDDRLNWLVGFYYSNDKGAGTQNSESFSARNVAAPPADAFGASTGIAGNQFYYAPFISAFEFRDLTIETWALFTQNDFNFTDKFFATVGLRYTQENQEFTTTGYRWNQNFSSSPGGFAANQDFECYFGPNAQAAQGLGRYPNFQTSPAGCAVKQDTDANGVSYLFGLNYKVTPEHLLYARLSRGFNGGALQIRLPSEPPARPVTADDIELGFKGEWLDRRVRTNLAIWRTDYEDQQVSVSLNFNVPPTSVIRNAGKVRFQGAEAELSVHPVQGFTAFANVGYVEAYYRDYPGAVLQGVPGNPVVNAAGISVAVPKWTGNAGARYERGVGPGVLSVQTTYSFASRTPLTPITTQLPTAVPLSIQEYERKARGFWSGQIAYELPEQGLTLAVFGSNLLNEEYATNMTPASLTGGVQIGYAREPRVWGVTIRKSFGAE
jgi:iron complex outermembrane receptor protein